MTPITPRIYSGHPQQNPLHARQQQRSSGPQNKEKFAMTSPRSESGGRKKGRASAEARNFFPESLPGPMRKALEHVDRILHP